MVDVHSPFLLATPLIVPRSYICTIIVHFSILSMTVLPLLCTLHTWTHVRQPGAPQLPVSSMQPNSLGSIFLTVTGESPPQEGTLPTCMISKDYFIKGQKSETQEKIFIPHFSNMSPDLFCHLLSFSGSWDLCRAYWHLQVANYPKSERYFHSRGNYEAAQRGPGGVWAAKVLR